MSFSVDFYKHTKSDNSTKQPSGSGTAFDCIIKDGCSVVAPDIQLQMAIDANPTEYNYAYIADFHRYYFVTDWYFENRLWHARLRVDPMATYKSQIGSYSGYVLRSNTAYNPDIIDTYYPIEAELTEIDSPANQDPGWSTDIGSGTFVIGVMGKNASPNGGAITYYGISPAGMTAIVNYLLDEANFSGVTDITPDLLKCIMNPLQYIVSCMWFPFTITGTGTSSIYVGWWEITGVNALKITDAVYSRNISFSVAKHPQAVRGNYLNMQPFSSYLLSAGPWGIIPISNVNVINKTTLNAIMKVDLYTGSGRFSIIAPNQLAYVEDHMAQIGVPIALGQNVINQGALTGAAGGLGGMVGNAISGNIAGLIGSSIETIGSVAELSQGVPSTVGSNGSMAFNTRFSLLGRFMTVADEDKATRGRPLCAKRTMSSLSGYILCADADPAIPGTDSEQADIVNYMNSGFYYE